jgi:hypothetical protein
MVSLASGFDQRGQNLTMEQKIDHVLAHGAIEIGEHRHGRAAEYRNPFLIGGAGEIRESMKRPSPRLCG